MFYMHTDIYEKKSMFFMLNPFIQPKSTFYLIPLNIIGCVVTDIIKIRPCDIENIFYEQK